MDSICQKIVITDPAEIMEQRGFCRQKPMIEALARGDSAVPTFYKQSTIFVTGGTGFLGKLLIEKLFRTCAIRRIYIIVRPKNNKSPGARLKEITSDLVFDSLRNEQPNFVKKLTFIEGDVSKLKLGISDDDRKIIIEEVDVIFHMAANIRFDVNLTDAVLSNVRGTREVLELGKACRKLQAFVHVSTSFSHATKCRIGKEVLEEFGESPVSPEIMIQMAESISRDKLNKLTPTLIENWSNTYTFTKAVAEEIVRTVGCNFPVCIMRPAIVTSTYTEPVPGWLDTSNVYGPSGIVIGTFMGLFRVVFANSMTKLDFVPADMVVNATIIAAWTTVNKRAAGYQETDIYTVTSNRNPITWRLASTIWRELRFELASPKTVWFCNPIMVKHPGLYALTTWLLHYIPAYIIDGLRVLVGRKERFVKLFKKSYKLCSVLGYFTCNEWHPRDDNLKNLYNGLSETDKVIYNFDITTIDWKENIAIWWVGVRKYILKDGLKDTKKSVRKQYYYCIADFLLKTIILFLLWKLFQWVCVYLI